MTLHDRRCGVHQLVVALQRKQPRNLADDRRALRYAELPPYGQRIDDGVEEPVELHAAVDRREFFRPVDTSGDGLLADDGRNANGLTLRHSSGTTTKRVV